VLTYRATIPLSTRSLTHLADLLRAERARRGTRYRRLDPGRQALLVLARAQRRHPSSAGRLRDQPDHRPAVHQRGSRPR
jgi:hypothetical protein